MKSRIAEKLRDSDPVSRELEAERRCNSIIVALANTVKHGAGRAPRDKLRWQLRRETLETTAGALRAYLDTLPVGAAQDVQWFSEAKLAARRMLELVSREQNWRAEIERGDKELHPSLREYWSLEAKPGANPTHRHVVHLAVGFGLRHDDVARLESVGRLPVEPWLTSQNGPTLRAWDPEDLEDTLFLVRGDGTDLKSDDRLFDNRLKDRWRKNFSNAAKGEGSRS